MNEELFPKDDPQRSLLLGVGGDFVKAKIRRGTESERASRQLDWKEYEIPKDDS